MANIRLTAFQRFIAALITALSVTLIAVASPVQAQSASQLASPFDARRLTHADKVFLQAGLALKGYYDGLLDGEWGPNSQNSFERFTWAEFQTAPQDGHMALLAGAVYDWATKGNWGYQYLEDLSLSILIPFDSIVWDQPSQIYANFHDGGSSLAYSVSRSGLQDAIGFHEYTLNWHERTDAPFVVRSERLLVTSSVKRDGSILYTRSDYVRGGWSTVILSANGRDGTLLGLVSSGIQLGRTDPIVPTRGGHLDRVIDTVIAMVQEGERAPRAHGSEDQPTASGTGFFVNRRGYILTNEHVVSGCRSVVADGKLARVIGVSRQDDLAVLSVETNGHQPFARFSPSPARLNSDVTVIGYPLAGALGGLNVTRGTVSSLKGLHGANDQFQISAPVQPGNSGGPVIGRDGEAVGVVVAKLDAAQYLEATGDIPQNVNFAISGEVAKHFLASLGIRPELGQSDVALDPVDLAETASGFTVFIECY